MSEMLKMFHLIENYRKYRVCPGVSLNKMKFIAGQDRKFCPVLISGTLALHSSIPIKYDVYRSIKVFSFKTYCIHVQDTELSTFSRRYLYR